MLFKLEVARSQAMPTTYDNKTGVHAVTSPRQCAARSSCPFIAGIVSDKPPGTRFIFALPDACGVTPLDALHIKHYMIRTIYI